MRAFIIACALMCVVGCGGTNYAEQDDPIIMLRKSQVQDMLDDIAEAQQGVVEAKYYAKFPDTEVVNGGYYEFARSDYIHVVGVCDNFIYVEYASMVDGEVVEGMRQYSADEDFSGYRAVSGWHVVWRQFYGRRIYADDGFYLRTSEYD